MRPIWASVLAVVCVVVTVFYRLLMVAISDNPRFMRLVQHPNDLVDFFEIAFDIWVVAFVAVATTSYSVGDDKQKVLRPAWLAIIFGLLLLVVATPLMAVFFPGTWYKIGLPDLIAACTLTLVVYAQEKAQ